MYVFLIEQSAVLADAHQVIHTVSVTPAQHSSTIEAAVTPEQDAGIGSVLQCTSPAGTEWSSCGGC